MRVGQCEKIVGPHYKQGAKHVNNDLQIRRRPPGSDARVSRKNKLNNHLYRGRELIRQHYCIYKHFNCGVVEVLIKMSASSSYGESQDGFSGALENVAAGVADSRECCRRVCLSVEPQSQRSMKRNEPKMASQFQNNNMWITSYTLRGSQLPSHRANRAVMDRFQYVTSSYKYKIDREERTIEHHQALPDSLYRDFGYDVKHSLRSPSTL
uniref:SFRICE_010425 n=1 Tax=Spodoptera frugiperda TaxID=7108 RepID=A0A2H1V6H0_SPOFR